MRAYASGSERYGSCRSRTSLPSVHAKWIAVYVEHQPARALWHGPSELAMPNSHSGFRHAGSAAEV